MGIRQPNDLMMPPKEGIGCVANVSRCLLNSDLPRHYHINRPQCWIPSDLETAQLLQMIGVRERR
ncbi:MAG: hypothetical protein JW395_1113 [Nitrospira sp.]|nr:hypothetical protein [Nitrospira sp.]